MKFLRAIAIIPLFIMFLFIKVTAAAQDVQRITKEELEGKLENPDLVIIDVRSGRDWKSSEAKIKGAVREEPRKARV